MTTRKYREIKHVLQEICQPVAAPEQFKNRLLNDFVLGTGRLNSGNEAVESRTQKIAVVVHIDANLMSGVISIPAEMRLSDYLNTPIQFIKLSEVSISRLDGSIDKAGEIHINKESVRMIRTKENDAARGAGSQVENSPYRVIKKIPVRAAMQMADYEIDGCLYCQDSGIERLLEQKLVFLPCTEVSIRDIHHDKQWQTGFAALNRKQVYSLQTVSKN